ncbi:MFS transporter [Bombilactobacillus folatiphilus]|uniref:MFS transporter n=1 Tax=Bombilactobacillus folatiphilus TaxID=2923362 RepID=A0ABY4P8H7_9LACO|nr:MFS transporter [Bombilactobacillus folatiphilus]UQS82003.1 MFS transporter [Bombilactobacillus folatiphilus]
MFSFLKRNPLFTQISCANLLSKIGDRLFYTAMLSTAAALPHSKIAVMIVSVSETLPILFSFFLGSLADQKRGKMDLLIKNTLLRALLYLGIGALFRYPQTLLLLILASCFNFGSDLAGNYSSSLIAPFTKNLIQSDEMTTAQGLLSMATQLMNVAATLIGAMLLSFFKKLTVANLNALLFAVVGLGFGLIRPQLKPVENQLQIHPQESVLATTKRNFQSLWNDKPVFNNLCQLALLNGLFGGLTPVFTLFIPQNKSLAFLSQPLKIALLSGLITVGMIVGNLLSTKIWVNRSIQQLNHISNLFVAFIGLSFLQNSLYGILVLSGILALLLGIVSPRFSASIINHYSTERLGGMMTTVNSLLVLIPPVTSVLFPILSNVSLTTAYLGFVGYSGLLFLLNWVISKLC